MMSQRNENVRDERGQSANHIHCFKQNLNCWKCALGHGTRNGNRCRQDKFHCHVCPYLKNHCDNGIRNCLRCLNLEGPSVRHQLQIRQGEEATCFLTWIKGESHYSVYRVYGEYVTMWREGQMKVWNLHQDSLYMKVHLVQRFAEAHGEIVVASDIGGVSGELFEDANQKVREILGTQKSSVDWLADWRGVFFGEHHSFVVRGDSDKAPTEGGVVQSEKGEVSDVASPANIEPSTVVKTVLAQHTAFVSSERTPGQPERHIGSAGEVGTTVTGLCQQNLQAYTSRRTYIGSAEVTTTQKLYTRLFVADVKEVVRKIVPENRGYQLMLSSWQHRMAFRFTTSASSPPLCVAQLIIVFVPPGVTMSEEVGGTINMVREPSCMTMLPSVRMKLQLSQEVPLVIPFINYFKLYPTFSESIGGTTLEDFFQRPDSLGQFHVYLWNTLRMEDPAVPVKLQFFMNLEDIQYRYPAKMQVPSQMFSQEEEWEIERYKESIRERRSFIKRGNEDLVEMALGAAAGMLILDKPDKPNANEWPTAVGPQASTRFMVNEKAYQAPDNSASASKPERPTVATYCNTLTRTAVQEWSAGDEVGTTLLLVPVTPMRVQSFNKLVGGSLLTVNDSPPWKAWRGSIRVCVEVVKNSFHRGKLIALLAPPGTSAVSIEDMAAYTTHTLDVVASDTLSFRVPWTVGVDWLPFVYLVAEGVREGAPLAVLNLMVQSPLQNKGSGVPVDVNVYMALEDDFRVMRPMYPLVDQPLMVNTERMKPAGGGDTIDEEILPSEAHEDFDNRTVPDAFCGKPSSTPMRNDDGDFIELMKRPTTVQEPVEVDTKLWSTGEMFTLKDTVDTKDTSVYKYLKSLSLNTLHKTVYKRLLSCYMAYSGGLRFTIATNTCATDRVLVKVTPHLEYPGGTREGADKERGIWCEWGGVQLYNLAKDPIFTVTLPYYSYVPAMPTMPWTTDSKGNKVYPTDTLPGLEVAYIADNPNPHKLQPRGQVLASVADDFWMQGKLPPIRPSSLQGAYEFFESLKKEDSEEESEEEDSPFHSLCGPEPLRTFQKKGGVLESSRGFERLCETVPLVFSVVTCPRRQRVNRDVDRWKDTFDRVSKVGEGVTMFFRKNTFHVVVVMHGIDEIPNKVRSAALETEEIVIGPTPEADWFLDDPDQVREAGKTPEEVMSIETSATVWACEHHIRWKDEFGAVWDWSWSKSFNDLFKTARGCMGERFVPRGGSMGKPVEEGARKGVKQAVEDTVEPAVASMTDKLKGMMQGVSVKLEEVLPILSVKLGSYAFKLAYAKRTSEVVLFFVDVFTDIALAATVFTSLSQVFMQLSSGVVGLVHSITTKLGFVKAGEEDGKESTLTWAYKTVVTPVIEFLAPLIAWVKSCFPGFDTIGSLKEALKNLSLWGSACRGATAVWQLLICVLKWIAGLFGQLRTPAEIAAQWVSDNSARIQQFVKDAMELLPKFVKVQYMTNEAKMSELTRLVLEGKDITSHTLEATGPAISLVRQLTTQLFKMNQQLPSTVISPFRQEPVCVWLWGEPGTGKSMLAMKLARNISKRLTGSDSDFFQVTTGIEYWNGYCGQSVVIMDDVCQGKNNTDFQSFCQMVSSVPFNPSQADLSDKHIFFDSKLVIVTANMVNPPDEDFKDKTAALRRYEDNCYHVSGQFKASDPSTPLKVAYGTAWKFQKMRRVTQVDGKKGITWEPDSVVMTDYRKLLDSVYNDIVKKRSFYSSCIWDEPDQVSVVHLPQSVPRPGSATGHKILDSVTDAGFQAFMVPEKTPIASTVKTAPEVRAPKQDKKFTESCRFWRARGCTRTHCPYAHIPGEEGADLSIQELKTHQEEEEEEETLIWLWPEDEEEKLPAARAKTPEQTPPSSLKVSTAEVELHQPPPEEPRIRAIKKDEVKQWKQDLKLLNRACRIPSQQYTRSRDLPKPKPIQAWKPPPKKEFFAKGVVDTEDSGPDSATMMEEMSHSFNEIHSFQTKGDVKTRIPKHLLVKGLQLTEKLVQSEQWESVAKDCPHFVDQIEEMCKGAAENLPETPVSWGRRLIKTVFLPTILAGATLYLLGRMRSREEEESEEELEITPAGYDPASIKKWRGKFKRKGAVKRTTDLDLLQSQCDEKSLVKSSLGATSKVLNSIGRWTSPGPRVVVVSAMVVSGRLLLVPRHAVKMGGMHAFSLNGIKYDVSVTQRNCMVEDSKDVYRDFCFVWAPELPTMPDISAYFWSETQLKKTHTGGGRVLSHVRGEAKPMKTVRNLRKDFLNAENDKGVFDPTEELPWYVFHGDSPSIENGECGSPVVLDNRSLQNPIIGFVSGSTTSGVVLTGVTREMVVKARATLSENCLSTVMREREVVPSVIARAGLEQPYFEYAPYLDCPEPPVIQTKTAFEKSPLHGSKTLQWISETKKEPAKIAVAEYPTGEKTLVGATPLPSTWCGQERRRPREPDTELMDEVSTRYGQWISSNMGEKMRVLATCEVLNGFSEPTFLGVGRPDREMDPIDMTTSVGPTLKHRGIHSKETIIEREEDMLKFREGWERKFDQLCDELEKGEMRAHVAFEALPKDELRTEEKVEKGKTRIYFCPNFFLQLAYRKYFGHFYSELRRHIGFGGHHAIGINPPTDWYWLGRAWADRPMLEYDVEAWDQSLSPTLMEYGRKVVEFCYGDCPLNERRARETLWHHMMYSECEMGGVPLLKIGGLPSGVPNTAETSSVLHPLVYIYSLMKQGITFLEAVNRKFLTYGDDQAGEVRSEEERDWLVEGFGDWGLKITSPSDKTKPPEVGTLEDVSFLKRKWRKIEHEGMVTHVPEIDPSTIRALLEWKRKSARQDEMYDNALQFCYEAGRADLYRMIVCLLTAKGEHLSYRIPSWEDLGDRCELPDRVRKALSTCDTNLGDAVIHPEDGKDDLGYWHRLRRLMPELMSSHPQKVEDIVEWCEGTDEVAPQLFRADYEKGVREGW